MILSTSRQFVKHLRPFLREAIDIPNEGLDPRWDSDRT
jgi:hypothetical protein